MDSTELLSIRCHQYHHFIRPDIPFFAPLPRQIPFALQFARRRNNPTAPHSICQRDTRFQTSPFFDNPCTRVRACQRFPVRCPLVPTTRWFQSIRTSTLLDACCWCLVHLWTWCDLVVVALCMMGDARQTCNEDTTSRRYPSVVH